MALHPRKFEVEQLLCFLEILLSHWFKLYIYIFIYLYSCVHLCEYVLCHSLDICQLMGVAHNKTFTCALETSMRKIACSLCRNWN